MSRTGRAGRSARRTASAENAFWTGLVGTGGWGEASRTSLTPELEMDPLAALVQFRRGDPTCTVRLTLRCRYCGGPVGVVFDGSIGPGGTMFRKLVTNGGHAHLAGEVGEHRFALSCPRCSWSAMRTGDDLAKKTGTMQLP